jgi:hypothetical protein
MTWTMDHPRLLRYGRIESRRRNSREARRMSCFKASNFARAAPDTHKIIKYFFWPDLFTLGCPLCGSHEHRTPVS